MKYKIHWTTLIPISGITPKKDAKKIGYLKGKIECSKHHSTKEKALAFLESLKGQLSKRYIAVAYTDAQFGLRKEGQDLTSILTKKQLKEARIVQ